MFDEDFGKMKMEGFRERCRNILGGSSSQQSKMRTGNADLADEEELGDDVAYTSEVVDIVTAYKSLKLVMSKNTKGLAEGREQCTGKNYLKPTMASRQQSRGFRVPPVGGSGIGTANAAPQAMLPMIDRGRMGTAPTQMNGRGHSRSTRAQTRGSVRTRGMDGLPLPPRAAPHQTQTGFHGMTLQDYATGNLWGRNGGPMATSSSGGLFSKENSAKSRQATAPCWRKTRPERVDEKIARLRRSDKLAAEAGGNELLMSDREKRSRLVQQYFPGKELPLSAYQPAPEDDK